MDCPVSKTLPWTARSLWAYEAAGSLVAALWYFISESDICSLPRPGLKPPQCKAHKVHIQSLSLIIPRILLLCTFVWFLTWPFKLNTHHPSSSVSSHGLIPRNPRVLSSTKIIPQINLDFKIFFVLFHQAITVYRCLLMDALLKIHVLSVSVTLTRLTTSWVGDRPLATLTIQIRSSNPPPFTLTVSNWLTI
jgi:hypothetical protein